MGTPLAYFITFTCYGTWLHGDERGSVDDEHHTPGTPLLPPDPQRRARERNALVEPPYQLDAPRRLVALDALCEIARRKGWTLHAAHVRSNHVHIVVTAEGPPERVMNDFKTAASRRLNKAFPAERDRTRWTRHGSTRYLWTEDAVAEKVQYVLFGQGEPMERFPSTPIPTTPIPTTPSRARSESSSGVSGP
jgi:REP element-mobilizing transposase RayT